MADWKDEAANLPLWPGCTYYTGESPGDFDEVAQMPTLAASPATFSCDGMYPGDPLSCPALDHPDTQAAYLRRLAIRLGCPEEVANAGVVFYAEEGYAYWTVAAGGLDDCGDWVWCPEEVAPNVGDRLLALVRAWSST